MKKLFVAIAMIMTTVIAMAQSQLYVIMKDGSGASYPEEIVDSLTFDENNGAKIYGFEDLLNNFNSLKVELSALKDEMTGLRSEIANLKDFMTNNLVSKDSLFEHEYVDLELPSGLLWATTNVGAKREGEIGYYFAYGETVPKSSYSTSNYLYHGYDAAQFKSNNIINSLNILTPEHDVATVFWGPEWMMPSSRDLDELVNFCDYKWAEVDGENGMLFTSRKNGKSIFLPGGGYYNDKSKLGPTRGYYLSSTLGYSGISGTLFTHQDGAFVSTMNSAYGKSVRPVRRMTRDSIFHDNNDSLAGGYQYVDLGLPSGTLWSNMNLMSNNVNDYGKMFAWGETESKLSSEMTEENSLWLNLTDEELLAEGVIDENGNLTPKHDAATVIRGDYWRIPTKEEFEELLENCTIEFVNIVAQPQRYKFTGKNGNSIEILINSTYWTATSDGQHLAYHTSISKDGIEGDASIPIVVRCMTPHGKCYGSFIRPVVRK